MSRTLSRVRDPSERGLCHRSHAREAGPARRRSSGWGTAILMAVLRDSLPWTPGPEAVPALQPEPNSLGQPCLTRGWHRSAVQRGDRLGRLEAFELPAPAAFANPGLDTEKPLLAPGPPSLPGTHRENIFLLTGIFFPQREGEYSAKFVPKTP